LTTALFEFWLVGGKEVPGSVKIVCRVKKKKVEPWGAWAENQGINVD